MMYVTGSVEKNVSSSIELAVVQKQAELMEMLYFVASVFDCFKFALLKGNVFCQPAINSNPVKTSSRVKVTKLFKLGQWLE